MDKSEMDPLDHMTSDATMEIDNESDDSSSGSSVFKIQCVPSSPNWRPKNTIRKPIHSSKIVETTDSSSDSSVEPRPLTLKALIAKFKKKKRKRRKQKYKATGRPVGRPKGRKNTKISHVDKNQFKDKGPRFSFLESENGTQPSPWRKILTFEQAVARGFFNYIEKLKYEYHLKESLKQMDVGDDLEKEDLDSRRYKYLDDDGSISPIEESVAEDEEAAHPEQEECDIKLVDSSCFIINSEFPKLMNVNSEQNVKEAVSYKKRASKVKNTAQKMEPPEKETATGNSMKVNDEQEK
nr:TATA box-binding protein-associated factor RNA polymerase I subunit D-like [Oryctolagus cuniculus]